MKYFNLRAQFFNIKAHHHAFETNDLADSSRSSDKMVSREMFFFDWQKIRHFESRKITKMSTRGAKRNEMT